MKIKRVLTKLEAVRKQEGLTLSDFTDKYLPVSRQAYSYFLNGQRKPSKETLQKMMELLKDKNIGVTFKDTSSATVVRDNQDIWLFAKEDKNMIQVDRETIEAIKDDD